MKGKRKKEKKRRQHVGESKKFDRESLKCVCIYQNAIETQFPKLENTQNVFSVSIIYHSEIKELSDENKN